MYSVNCLCGERTRQLGLSPSPSTEHISHRSTALQMGDAAPIVRIRGIVATAMPARTTSGNSPIPISGNFLFAS